MNKLTEKHKRKFLNDENWNSTVAASFGRASVYHGFNLIDSRKDAFKSDLRVFINELIEQNYKTEISDKKHGVNIEKICDFSKNHRYSEFLTAGMLKIGVCQKLLNLQLKYKWCLGEIPTPPHFPVDRRIQEELIISAKVHNKKVANETEKLEVPIIHSWTKMEEMSQYCEIIAFAKKIQRVKGSNSLAELELELFNQLER